MPRSWKSQIADEVRATSMMKPKWPDDAMAHIASLQADNDHLRQLLSEAEKREREARAKALEEAAAYHLAKMKLFQKTSETAIVPSTIERSKLAIVFHEASAVALRALQSEER